MPKKSLPHNPSAERIIHHLTRHTASAKDRFRRKHQHAHRWLRSHNLDLTKLRSHSKRLLTSGVVASTLMLSPPNPYGLPQSSTVKQRLARLHLNPGSYDRHRLTAELTSALPNSDAHLASDQEQSLEQQLQTQYGITATNNLDGHKLNSSVGFIGSEQHLKRFPGDNLSWHDEYQQSGIAPGLGAWGYFTYSKDSFTKTDLLREKYYFAVQTLYLPDWNQNHQQLAKWYKYRKMIAINPQNGAIVVGVVADAGPAAWTGKQFGGSPEVIHTLRSSDNPKLGKIILLFVDDPSDQIPLGPVTTPISFQIGLT